MSDDRIRFPRRTVLGAMAIAGAAAMAPALPSSSAFGETTSEPFGPLETIPDPVRSKICTSMVYAETPTGPQLITVTNGVPGVLWAVDAITGELIASVPAIGTSIAYGITQAGDGNVYFCNAENGGLFRYDVTAHTITSLGKNPSGSFVWELRPSADGSAIYGAVYPKAKVFRYDIATAQFTDLGSFRTGKDYVRSLDVTDRYVYGGLGPFTGSEQRLVIRHDIATGERIAIPVPGATQFIYGVQSIGGKLLVRGQDPTPFVYVLDEETLVHEATYPVGGTVSPPSPSDPNVVYFTGGNSLYRYDLAGATATVAAALPSNGRGQRVMAWLPDGTLIGGTKLGELLQLAPGSNQPTVIELEIAGSPAQLHSITAGPDGRVYLGGYHQGVSIYDPAAGAVVVNQPHSSQAESIGWLGTNIYYGMYGKAIILRYDTTQPWNYGTNPKTAHQIVKQDRPYVMTRVDQLLAIGTIPGYGQLGGAVVLHDPTANTWTQYDHDQLVPNQSITGLTHSNGRLFGSTSIKGGLGINPTETEARVFSWDIAGERLLLSKTLDLPGHNPSMIGNVTMGADGLVWVAIGSAVAALDPDTLTVIKSRTYADPALDHSEGWRPYGLQFGPDGMLYSTIGHALTMIDPDSLDAVTLAPKVYVMSVATNGDVWFHTRTTDAFRLPTRLASIALTAPDAVIRAGQSLPLHIKGQSATGGPLDLTGALMSYRSRRPEVVTIDADGTAEANLPGVTEVQAEVQFRGETVVSPPLRLRVQPLRGQ